MMVHWTALWLIATAAQQQGCPAGLAYQVLL
jgi:hypothetical protein